MTDRTGSGWLRYQVIAVNMTTIISIKYILDFRFHKLQHVHKWRYNGSSHELVVSPCEKEEDPSASEESRTEARIPDRDG